MLSWNRRRQIQYLLLVIAFLGVVGASTYWYAKPLPTCFDGQKNQGEINIDCGGPCTKVCLEQVAPIRTLLSRPFEIVPGVYTVIGLFANDNRTLGVDRLFYKIRLTNDLGATVGTRDGEVFVNPQEKFVIFEPNIDTNNQKPIRAFVDFMTVPNWAKPPVDKPILSVVRKEFTLDPLPKLHALLTNESTYDLSHITVPVIISDPNHNVFTGSATVVETLARGATTDIYFTWPQAFPADPASVDFYPRVDTFKIER